DNGMHQDVLAGGMSGSAARLPEQLGRRFVAQFSDGSQAIYRVDPHAPTTHGTPFQAPVIPQAKKGDLTPTLLMFDLATVSPTDLRRAALVFTVSAESLATLATIDPNHSGDVIQQRFAGADQEARISWDVTADILQSLKTGGTKIHWIIWREQRLSPAQPLSSRSSLPIPDRHIDMTPSLLLEFEEDLRPNQPH
ncbi:MAG: hypothetical protein ACREI3_03875, partial [Nitrospirales bacterium]